VSDEVGDLINYKGGVWEIVSTCFDWYDPSDHYDAYNLEWVAGPRETKIVYVTGVRHTEIKRLTDMEVIALAAVGDCE